MASFGIGASELTAVGTALCTRPGAGAIAPITDFHSITGLTTKRVLSAAGSATPAAGTYTDGACVQIPAGDSIDNTDYTNGWFVDTN